MLLPHRSLRLKVGMLLKYTLENKNDTTTTTTTHQRERRTCRYSLLALFPLQEELSETSFQGVSSVTPQLSFGHKVPITLIWMLFASPFGSLAL